MAQMSVCRDCDRDISASAKTCPHCGAKHPTEGPVEWWFHRAGNALFIVGVGMMLLWWFLFRFLGQ